MSQHIACITDYPIRLTIILAIMLVSTFKTAVILNKSYRHMYRSKNFFMSHTVEPV